MNKFKLAVMAGLVVAGSAAHATVVNFISLTESGTGLGESAWTTLNVASGALSITGTATNDNDNQQFAYLDWGTAGLGVCKDATSFNSANTGSGANKCNPGSDDNVTAGEYLTFTFAQNTWVDGLYVNTNHDAVNYFQTAAASGKSKNDVLSLNGVDTAVKIYGVKTTFNELATDPFFVAAGSSFTLGFENKQFYVSKISFTTVPEPATFGLLALGLAGIGAARRKQATK